MNASAFAVSYAWEKPANYLPIAARPAMRAFGVSFVRRGIVVEQLDVGRERGACKQRFEKIVTQQRVRRHAVFERVLKRVDVVQALAGEAALAEEVLVNVGNGGRVRIDAGVAGKDLDQLRTRGARERNADARLQNAVAVNH